MATRFGHQIAKELKAKGWTAAPPDAYAPDYFGDELLIDPMTGARTTPHDAERIQCDREGTQPLTHEQRTEAARRGGAT